MIEYLGVSRSYGNRLAVDDLHLEIPPGQLFAFLGPNGAGKTTTMKMAVGLLRKAKLLSLKACSPLVSTVH